MTGLRWFLAAVLLIAGGAMAYVFMSVPTIANMTEYGFVDVLVSRSREAPIEMATLGLVLALIAAHFATAVTLVARHRSRHLWLAGVWLLLDAGLIAIVSLMARGFGAH